MKYRVLVISALQKSVFRSDIRAAAAFCTLARGVPATEELGKASGLEERGALLGVDIICSIGSSGGTDWGNEESRVQNASRQVGRNAFGNSMPRHFSFLLPSSLYATLRSTKTTCSSILPWHTWTCSRQSTVCQPYSSCGRGADQLTWMLCSFKPAIDIRPSLVM